MWCLFTFRMKKPTNILQYLNNLYKSLEKVSRGLIRMQSIIYDEDILIRNRNINFWSSKQQQLVNWPRNKSKFNYLFRFKSRELDSIWYWPKRALLKKGHQKFHHPLFNSFFKLFCIKIKFSIIFTKVAASDCQMHKMSRLEITLKATKWFKKPY